MPYGTKAALPGGALAVTGFAAGGWIAAAVTLMFIGIALWHFARPSPAERP